MILNTSRWEIVMKTTGLTLREAIESGKLFKSKSSGQHYRVDPKNPPEEDEEIWTMKEIFANDFELVEPREWDVWVHHENPNVITMQSPRNAELVNSDEWSKIRVREIL